MGAGAYWSRALLFGLLLIVAALYLGVILDGYSTAGELWFPIFLYVVAGLALLLKPQAPGVEVFAALLASLSVLFLEIFTGIPPYIEGLPDWANTLVAFVSDSVILLFPFAFVHFSLVFPAVDTWYQHRRVHALLLIYIPLALLLLLHAIAVLVLETNYSPLDSALILFPLGFLLGLGLFIRRYLSSLTTTEKNRLRVIVVGCLAGGVPVILAKLTDLARLADLALLLLPLFPVSLVLAVLKEDFAEPGPAVQKALRISMVTAGGVSTFFLASLVLSLAFNARDALLWLISLAVALATIVPLARWSGSFLGTHFPLTMARPSRSPQTPPPLFELITPNPYIVGNPVSSKEMFFGREEDFQFIRTKLEGQRQGCVVLICGERRAGKSSILYQILNGRLGAEFVPVFLDMQELVVRDEHGFMEGLCLRISRSMTTRLGTVAPSLPRDYPEMTAFFDRLMQDLGAPRLVLLFDEYELIAERVREGRLRPELCDYLNSLLERHPRLSMVFAGSRPLAAEPIFGRLLGKSFYRKISFLALPDAVDLICKPLQGRVRFEGEAISDLIVLTHGHPFFVQLLCQALVERLNDTQKTCVTSEMVSHVVARTLESPPPQLLYKWSGYSASEKLVLAGLATLVKKPASYVPAERLVRLILSLPSHHRADLDAVGIRIVLEDLRRDETLDRDQDRYRFTMDLLGRYIKAEHTVWSVLGERAVTSRGG